MSIIYGVTEEIYELRDDRRTSFGIVAYAESEINVTAVVVASVHGITADRKSISELAAKCNQLKLDTIHLSDVVDDFLSR